MKKILGVFPLLFGFPIVKGGARRLWVAACLLGVFVAFPAQSQSGPSASANSLPLSIDGGVYHTCMVKSDGSMLCWGANTWGQLDPPGTNSGYTQVSTGQYHTCGLKNDGSIVCWGLNDYGQTAPPVPNNGFIQVAGGGWNTCALKENGSVICWGRNNYGQSTPPEPNSGYIQVDATIYHTCGLKGDGSVACWGYNEYGESTPPDDNSGFSWVDVGNYFSCGLKAEGSVVCWGTNGDGQLDVPEPNQGFIQIRSGGDFVCGRKISGALVCWGNNQYEHAVPPAVNGSFVDFGVGSMHACAVRADEALDCWGYNEYGQAPQVTVSAPKLSAMQVGGYVEIPFTAEGSLGTLAPYTYTLTGGDELPNELIFTPDGRLIGNAQTSGRYRVVVAAVDNSPARFSGQREIYLTILPYVSVGSDPTCKIDVEGHIDCWGQYNVFPPEPNSDFVQVSSGNWHSCGLKSDGSIACWGDNGFGQSTPPEPNTGFVQVAAGAMHTCVLKETGEIHCWGSPLFDILQLPQDNHNFVSLALEPYHACALHRSGEIACWGYDVWDQLLPPEPNQDFVAVDVGKYFSCGLKSEGTIHCWGDASFGKTSPPQSSIGFRTIHVREDNACGLRHDRNVECWGNSQSGLTDIPGPHSGFSFLSLGAYKGCGLRQEGGLDCWGFSVPWKIFIDPDALPPADLGLSYTQAITPTNGYPPYLILIPAGSPGTGIELTSTGVLTGTPVFSGANPFILQATGSNVVQSSGEKGYTLYVHPAMEGGVSHYCAVLPGGTVGCWGDNEYGQSTPPPPQLRERYLAVSAGLRHTCGLRDDGTIRCWGDNANGQSNPPGNSNYMQVSAGDLFTCGLKRDGQVVCWGDNQYGQTNAPALQNFLQISAGKSHACGVLGTGGLMCWGRNDSGQTELPEWNQAFIQVTAGGEHTCALKVYGHIDCWGKNDSGQATPPPLRSAMMISAGENHTCALDPAHEIFCWGANEAGQATPPELEVSFAQVSAGGDASCGLRSEGTLSCWGKNDTGQAPVLVFQTRLLPVANLHLPYSATLTASGGTPPYAFTLVNSELPPGLALLPDGGLEGLPTQSGAYTFRVQVRDATAIALSVSRDYVLRVNTPPDALVDAYAGEEDVQIAAAAPGVLTNDSDLDGDPLQAVLENGPVAGTILLDPDGSFTYTPESDFFGEDRFTYRADDGMYPSEAVTVTLTITPVNDAPTAQPDAYTMIQGQTLAVLSPGVLANDQDVEGDALSANLISGPQHGALRLQPDGSLTYIPAPGFSGEDQFTYQCFDGELLSEPVRVTLAILPSGTQRIFLPVVENQAPPVK